MIIWYLLLIVANCILIPTFSVLCVVHVMVTSYSCLDLEAVYQRIHKPIKPVVTGVFKRIVLLFFIGNCKYHN